MAFITEKDLGLNSAADSLQSVAALPAFQPVLRAHAQAQAKPQGSGLLDVATAAFRERSTVTSLYENAIDPYTGSKEFDRTFSPRRRAVEDGLAEYQDQFTNVGNPEQYEYVKGRVLQQKEAKKVVENAGGLGVGAAITASLLDPVGMMMMTVPVLGEARIAKIGSDVARISARAGSYAAAGVGFGVIQEGVLNQVRPSTDADQVTSSYSLEGDGTKIAVAAGIGMAMFGAVGRAAGRASKDAVGKALDKLMVDPNGALLPAAATDLEKAAATAVNSEASKLYTNAGVKAVDAIVEKGSFGMLEGIGMTLAKSPFDSVRKWGQQIAPDIMQRIGTKEGIASPANAKIISMMEANSDINGFGTVLRDGKKSLDSLKELTPAQQAEVFEELRLLGVGVNSFEDVTPAVVQHYMQELVGYATQRGGRHVVAEIEAASKKLTAIFQKDAARINPSGLLGKLESGAAKQLDNASPYFTYVFKSEVIAANQLKWVAEVSPYIEQTLIRNGSPVAEAARQAEAIAVKAANNLTGASSTGAGSEFIKALAESGPMGKLIERQLDVPYKVLAPYLEHDAFKVLNVYKRSIEPQLALKETFGFTSFTDFNANVMAPEGAKLKQALLDSAKTATGDDLARINAELAGFDEAWKADTERLQTLFDSLMGKTKMSENAHTALARNSRILRKGVGMAMLSGQVISSLVDVPRQVMTHGLTPVMGAWGNYLTSSSFRAMGKETAERVGVALELTAFKLKTHGDNAFGGMEREMVGYMQSTKERIADRATEGFQWLNGAMLWNDSIRTTTALLAEDRLLRAATTGWDKLSKMDREWMLVLGIDEKSLAGIAAAQAGNTATTRRFMHTDIENWADANAARDFKLAVLKDAHTTNATPFRGTMPSWYDSEAGKFIWQFKSFMSASYQQTMMVGLQRNDARVWMGLVNAVGVGMAIVEIKDIFSAAPSKEKPLVEKVLAGVDRSGVADMPVALAGYVNAGIASVTGKSLDPFAENNRRPKGFLDSVLGPTGSAATSVGRGIKEGVTNGFNEKAQQEIAKAVPFHKIMGVDVGRALIESIHGSTQYIDKVTDSFKKAMPSWGETGE
jgi:hypothetical protein